MSTVQYKLLKYYFYRSSFFVQVPLAVTHSTSSEWTCMCALESAVCMLAKAKAVKDGRFYLVLTQDLKARVALQLMSPRFPVLCNVIVGLTCFPGTDQGLAQVKTMVKDHAWPTLLEADALPPVDWDRHPVSYGCSPIPHYTIHQIVKYAMHESSTHMRSTLTHAAWA